MASITSLMSSSSSSSSIYGTRSNNMITGLASGMDTEAMIEGMVQNIKQKLTDKKQEQTILKWQQQGIQGISNQLVQLSQKYTSYTSSTNLASTSFFGSTSISASGVGSDKLTVSGTMTGSMEILSATTAVTETVVFNGLNTTNGLNTASSTNINGFSGGGIDLNAYSEIKESCTVAGQTLSFKVKDGENEKTINITFDENANYNDLGSVADVFNAMVSELKNTGDLSPDFELEASVEGNRFTIKGADGSNIELLDSSNGSSKPALDALGLKAGTATSGSTITGNEVSDDKLFTYVSNKDLLSNAQLTFSYNGTNKTITLPSKIDANGKIDAGTDEEKELYEYIQDELDKAFGYGRVKVTYNDTTKDYADSISSGLKFEVTGAKTDTFALVSGTKGADKALGLEYGASNRVNLKSKISDLLPDGVNAGNGMWINGSKIEGITADSTLEEVIKAINENENAGVNVEYSYTTNQFVFTSKHGGAGGKIEITGNDNLAVQLFGEVDTSEMTADGDIDNGKVIKGKDAEIVAKINGVQTTLKNSSDTFIINGASITLNGNIAASADGSGIKLSQNIDEDKIVDTIKTFVEEYNAMLADLSEAYTTRPDKDYEPLTDDEKAELSDKQIEEFEEKAKQGILYGDDDLEALASDLRFIFSGMDLKEIGLTTSDEASDKGKLVLDEEKLRQALQEDPEAVANAFAGETTTNEVGLQVGGAMNRLDEVLQKYVKTTGATKGILIERAGSEFAATSLIQNKMKDQLEDINDEIDKITDQLNAKIDFYTSKFTQLELLINEANSQSGYLASFGGY